MIARPKLAGISGILAVILSLAIFVMVPPFPTLASSAQQIVAYYPAHRFPFLVGNYLGAVAIVPAFMMLAYLTELVKRAESEGGWLWIMLLGTALVTFAVGASDLAIYQTVALTAVPGNEALAKGLSDLASVGFGFYFVMQSAFVAAASWAVLQTSVLPRWLGLLGAGVALLSLIASWGSIITTGELAAGGIVTAGAFMAFILWLLGLSIAIIGTPATMKNAGA